MLKRDEPYHDLEGFLTRLHTNAATATVKDRQQVLRLLVRDILIGPEKIIIRHRIPTRASTSLHNAEPDTEGDYSPGHPLCWGRAVAVDGQHRLVGAR
jgi:site-specific DNA recombinase